MRPDHLSYARLLKAAVLGAVIGLLFDLAVTLATGSTKAFTLAQIPSSVAFLLVGFAGGCLFELFKGCRRGDQKPMSLTPRNTQFYNTGLRVGGSAAIQVALSLTEDPWQGASIDPRLDRADQRAFYW